MTPRQAIARLFRLWALYARLDLLLLVRGPGTFLFWMVSDLIVGIGTASGTFLLAARFNGIGRWSLAGMVLLLGYALTANGVSGVLFNYNVAYISRRIGRGQLDHILIQPQPLWMALLTEGFAPFTGAMTMLPGVVLLVWGTGSAHIHITLGWLALLLLNLAASSAIALGFTYLWGTLAFWAPRAAEEINSATWRLLSQLAPFPFDGIGPGLLGLLLTVVPVGFLAWYPARALMGLDRWPLAPFVTPLVAIGFIALAAWAFGRGMKQYGRTGSQRYLALGHRS